MPEIVLFGATGYTGALTARAMVDRGLAPVLAGRNAATLQALAARLGGLRVRVADVADAASMARLVSAGDVLVSTVGPFTRHGQPALDAAWAARAHYLDSTGEPAFIRRVFEQVQARAAAGSASMPAVSPAGLPAAVPAVLPAFLPAFGYDYVPGNTAGAAALERAGPAAVRLDIGYFATGGRFAMSQGTAASLAGAMLEPGLLFNRGRLEAGYAGLRTQGFDVDGRPRTALSVQGSECIALPASYPRLRDVNVYLGWFGALSSALSLGSRAQAALFRLPGYRRLLASLAGRMQSSGRGPDERQRAGSGSCIVAVAGDAQGRPLATATLRGVDGYTYTARMLAWGAGQALSGGLQASGVLGPVAAFGLPRLIEGNREAGLELVVG